MSSAADCTQLLIGRSPDSVPGFHLGERVNQEFYALRIGAGGTTISTSPVATSYTRPDISQGPGNAGIARSAATSRATAARGSVTAFVLTSPSCISK